MLAALGSGARSINLRKKKRDPGRKPRFDWTYATISEKVSEISLSYDPETDTVSFSQPVENTYHQVSYERSKGPKVLNRVPLHGEALKLSSNNALEEFDLLVAIDTNTRVCLKTQHVSIARCRPA